MILNRKSIIIILLCFIFINCSNKDSMTIFPTGFVDPSDSSGGSGGSGGSGNTTELDVQLMYPLDDQTKLFSTTWGAHQRTFIVHIPPNFDSNYSIPLLFVLHGYTSSANAIHNYSGFDQIADQENFIAVYVQGTTDLNGTTGWNVNVVGTFDDVDDVGFFKALIQYFKTDYNIDSDKIFSSGMSLGGFMSYRLACELEEINGIGSVTGSHAVYYTCNPPNKKNIIHFHGNSDIVVPYYGTSWSVPVETVHDFWANNNNCQDQSQITVPDFNNDGLQSTQFISYNCDDNTEVILYKMEYEGHTWFHQDWGDDLNSSELIWEFFKDK